MKDFQENNDGENPSMLTKSILDNTNNDNDNTEDMLEDTSNNDTLMRTTFIGPRNGT